MKSWSSEKISIFMLVLLITGAIDSVRNLPTTALFGSSLVFFFIFAALVFLIPVALVSAELSSTWSEEEGGIYSWVRHAFGEHTAFFTIWLQWINSVVWFPTILLFIAATIAYLINPALTENKFYLITVILIIFWGLTLLGLAGFRASATFASLCAIIGMILPMGIIIVLALLWLVQGKPLEISLDWQSLLPRWSDSQSWSSLTAIITAFLGMELAAVHVRNIQDPQRNFPRAMFFAVVLILVTMIFGSLAIAFVVPQNKISLVDGVMQTFQAYHMSHWMPFIVLLLLIGSVGSMVNWIISPAKGLLMAAENGFLPKSMVYLNRHGVASRILILQAVLVTLLCGAFLLLPGISAVYWLFTDLSTELYVFMYIFMFMAAWRLKGKFPEKVRPFAIPGGRYGYYFVCLLGLLGCVLALVIGFIPPESKLDMGGGTHFRFIFSSGIVLMVFPAFLLCFRKHRSSAILNRAN